MTDYARPTDLATALALAGQGTARILAGGTDIYPSIQGRQIPFPVIDIAGLPDLIGMDFGNDFIRIGACTPWAQIASAPLPPPLHALQQAALQVGGRQIQTAGTIGGNLCNASPAADGVPPLLVLEARVELRRGAGRRLISLEDFLVAPRRTALHPGEVLTAILIPNAALTGQSRFQKLGARAYLVISIAMVAVRLTMQNNHIASVALAVGACSATARRLHPVEAALIGLPPEQAAAQITAATLAPYLSPLDDLRATAEYRLTAAAELLRRTVMEAACP